VDPIRVLIADMPGVLRGVVRHSLETHDDLQVVGELTTPEPLADAVARSGAQVVVIDAGHPEARGRWPAVALLALAADGREAWRVEPLGELSPEALPAAVRSAVSAV
jgi:DNA-binding NarL/FixJ family response regulator